jgi:hypothetical protein
MTISVENVLIKVAHSQTVGIPFSFELCTYIANEVKTLHPFDKEAALHLELLPDRHEPTGIDFGGNFLRHLPKIHD